MFDPTPRTLSDQERAELASLDEASKINLRGWVREMLAFLNEVVDAANLKTSDRPSLQTKVAPGRVRLLD